ncbi:MAG: dihydropteroate synthase [Flavobacteriales bacterium]|nr:dihydropteroate synthase [Flavobacteriales bacterium]
MKDTYLLDNYSINCKGNLIDFSTPKIMGIINLTPDSFYDGGKIKSDKDLLNKVEKFLSQGADFIDIGGYSSRPGAQKVKEEEEIKRIIPNLKLITNAFPDAIISVDTFRSKIAEESLINGASIINDISAWGIDEKLFDVIIKYKCPYVLMHMKGNPSSMQNNPTYNNVTQEIIKFLSNKLKNLQKNGVHDVIIDPGFGFGKSIEHNYKIMSELNQINLLNQPILVGISRKSMIYNLLEINSLKSINGTTALNMYALNNGAKILRVHDIKEAAECIKIYQQLKN